MCNVNSIFHTKDPVPLKNESAHKFVIRVVHVFRVHISLYLSV